MTQLTQLHPRPLRPQSMEMQGISRRTMEEHFKLYEGYVKKYNDIVTRLSQINHDPAQANSTYSEIRELKLELSFAIGGVKNHELYFAILGGESGRPTGRLESEIERCFGSIEAWETDLKASAMAARGWVWLAYDQDWNYLFNYIGDAQNTYPIWNANPILALDMYEHAYFIDYGTANASYIEAFMSVLDWKVIERNFDKVTRAQSLASSAS